MVVDGFTNRRSRVNGSNLFARKRKELQFSKQFVLYNIGPWIKPEKCIMSYTMRHYQNLPDIACLSTKSVCDV